MSERYGIIGGGVLGLTLAHRLRIQGHAVTVYESAAEVGGLAAAWNIGPVTWDKHYHVFLLSDTRVRGLLEELGLTANIRWVETKTGFYTDGRMHSMSSSWEFLKFPPLGLLDKVRLARTILKASKIVDPLPLEQETVESWLRRHSGNRTFEKIWRPLLRAKLGENYKIASAAFIWAIIARMYAARRTGLKKEMFGYVEGGYARILERFADSLEKRGVEIRLSQHVESVSGDGEGVRVVADGEARVFDRVLVTTAAPVAARLCSDITEAERSRLEGVKYQGIVCASLLTEKPLTQYYVTNITDETIPFTAVIGMSTLVDPAEFHGMHLTYLPKYVSPDDPLFDASDDVIKASFLDGLARMVPGFTADDVKAFRISRVRNVFAVSTLDYSRTMPTMRTSVPGLYLVNSARIAHGTLNVNESIQLAESALDTIALDAPRRPQGVLT